MSIENNPTGDTDDTNLDDFSAEFFGQTKAEPEPTNSEDDNEKEDSEAAPPEATDQDTQDASDEDDTTDGSEEDTTESDEEEEEAPAPKPKKNSAQERISELTAARREAERRADALEARLAALENGKGTKEETPAPAPKAAAEVTPPKPTDTNEDGTEKYPLGEFDPNFITDLADFRVEQRFAERERIEQEKQEQAKQQEAMGQLEAGWNEQIGTAKERYPDYDTKIANLQPVFSDVDAQYGDYLSTTLMSMEKGADILYYLADNPEEARAIVDSGPQRATIALGRLEARFLEDSPPARKQSNAPPPPPTNKGASAARGTVAPDTDDLDAFSDMFFKKR